MLDVKESIISTGIHTLELVAVLVCAYAVTRLFNIEQSEEIIALVLAALAKFARSYENIPVGDYVNER